MFPSFAVSDFTEKHVQHRGRERLTRIRSSLSHDLDDIEVRIVDRVWFHVAVTLATMLNTLQMGLEADHPEQESAWWICGNIFTAAFTLEMVIKLYTFKRHYFYDLANLLDCSLTVIAIFDCWILVILSRWTGDGQFQSLSVLRILRLFRLGRILKLLRSVRPLVLVIQGVIKSMSSAVYVCVLCVFIFYVFAIFLTQYLGRSNTDLYPGFTTDLEVIDEQSFMLNYNPYICFGSMLSSMFTLFNMAILAEWHEIVRPIAVKQPWYLPVFFIFMTCVSLSIMNVLIAVIVDSVTCESRRIEEAYSEEMHHQKLKILDTIQTLVQDIDQNHDGIMDVKELSEAMENNDELKQLLKNINLPRGWTASELLDMLDTNGDGMLSLAEFTTSIYRSMDTDDFQQLCIIQSSINQVKHLVRDEMRSSRRRYSSMEADIASIKDCLGIDTEGAKPFSTPSDQQSNASCQEHGSMPSDQQSKASCEENGTIQEHVIKSDASPELWNGNKLVSCMQLKEILDAALLLERDHLHEEFSSIKSCLESQLTCFRREHETFISKCCSSSVEVSHTQATCPVKHFGSEPIEISAGCPKPSGDLSHGCKGFTSVADLKSAVSEITASAVTSAMDNLPKAAEVKDEAIVPSSQQHTGIVLADELPISANPAVSLTAHDVHSENAVNGCLAALSSAAQLDLGAGTTNEARQPAFLDPEQIIHEFTDFIFEDGIQTLGFTVHWIRDGLPRVGETSVGGAANLKGVRPGDQLAECNSIPIAGKDRQAVLQLLVARPLVLRMLRNGDTEPCMGA